jgi:hypothetical protein
MFENCNGNCPILNRGILSLDRYFDNFFRGNNKIMGNRSLEAIMSSTARCQKGTILLSRYTIS